MTYQLVRCSEGTMESSYSPDNAVIAFGYVSSCLTLTVILDSIIMCAIHAVIKPNKKQKSWDILRRELAEYIQKYRKNSCVIHAAGALMNWKTDLSGPVTQLNELTITKNQHEEGITKTLRQWFPNSHITASAFQDCELYSCSYRENNKYQIATFSDEEIIQWKKYKKYAPQYAQEVINALN